MLWGLESICYVHERLDEFLKEAWRLLVPGGRFVVMDGFRGPAMANGADADHLAAYYEGFHLAPLLTVETIQERLAEGGFVNLEFTDKTANILRTSRDMARQSRWALPLLRLTQALGLTAPLLTQNIEGCIAQEPLFTKRIMIYGLLVGRKPD